MENAAMQACRALAGGGALGALGAFAVVFTALSALGAVALPVAIAVTGLGRASARIWGYAIE